MIATTLFGIVVILIFFSNLYAFLIGSLIITSGNFTIIADETKKVFK